MANKVGSITVEVRPTVTLESAVACVMMLNLFLAENEDYRLAIEDGKWHLTDEPFTPAMGGVVVRPLDNMTFTDEEKEILADMPALRNLARMAGLETE